LSVLKKQRNLQGVIFLAGACLKSLSTNPFTISDTDNSDIVNGIWYLEALEAPVDKKKYPSKAIRKVLLI
jgi:hypothetical protein